MNKNDNKKIYIVLSYTGTLLSKVIRLKTGAEFCHISIALDKDLKSMYSFGRLNPYTPLWAGFVHERIDGGTFRRFKNTKVEVYSIDVTSKQYEDIANRIKDMERKKDKYSFNIVGLLAAGFNVKYRKLHSFYCAEFVKYLIDEAGIELELPELVKPMDFKETGKLDLEYRGLLRMYKRQVG